MFKLDPHIDPLEDGENVFVVGLGSDVVFTFTPYFAHHAPRTDPTAVAVKSWSGERSVGCVCT
jgi:hypothetical protein